MKNYGDADNDCVRQQKKEHDVNKKFSKWTTRHEKTGEMLVIFLWLKLSTFALMLSLILSPMSIYCLKEREKNSTSSSHFSGYLRN